MTLPPHRPPLFPYTTLFRSVTDEELDARPELVKTMSVRPPIGAGRVRLLAIEGVDLQACGGTHVARTAEIGRVRSEEHTSELQSRQYLVCRLLLEKKKKTNK